MVSVCKSVRGTRYDVHGLAAEPNSTTGQNLMKRASEGAPAVEIGRAPVTSLIAPRPKR